MKKASGIWARASKKPMIGKVRVREGMRPGVVAFSLGHGHWAYGAGGVVIDGVDSARRIPAGPPGSTPTPPCGWTRS